VSRIGIALAMPDDDPGMRPEWHILVGRRKGPEAPNARPHRRPMLRHDNNVLHSIPLVPTVKERIPLLKKLFREHQNFYFSEKIVSRRTAPFPADPKPRHLSGLHLGILPATNRRTFRPANSRSYVF
jgi:hypothetical protein